MTYRGNDTSPPSPEKMEAIGRHSEAMFKSGVMVDAGGIHRGASVAVKLEKGKFAVTDGPFVETKELIVGYAIVQVKSLEEACELARQFMAVAGDGEGVIEQLSGPADEPPH